MKHIGTSLPNTFPPKQGPSATKLIAHLGMGPPIKRNDALLRSWLISVPPKDGPKHTFPTGELHRLGGRLRRETLNTGGYPETPPTP